MTARQSCPIASGRYARSKWRKGATMTQIGFYFDQTRCAGCKTCQVACKDKNRLGVGPVVRKVVSRQVGSFPTIKMYHVSASCNHCETPACMAKCPTGALSKNEDGAVVRDAEACIGCSSCVNACPYGHPQIDEASGPLGEMRRLLRMARGRVSARLCGRHAPYRALDFGDIEELREKYGDDAVSALPAIGEDTNRFARCSFGPARRGFGRCGCTHRTLVSDPPHAVPQARFGLAARCGLGVG